MTEQLLADAVSFDRAAARHLQSVLRLKPGDRVTLFDGCGRTRPAVVSEVGRRGLSLAAAGAVCEHPPPGCRVTLFACVIKGARMEWMVEKAVELGVWRIVPVISERTVARAAAGEEAAKAARWGRIAEEAARQCGAVWVPEVAAPLPLAASLPLVAETAPTFVAALTPAARPLREALGGAAPARAGWFVGPEGDFTAAELEALTGAGAVGVSLGGLVLRAETACLYGLCALNAAWL